LNYITKTIAALFSEPSEEFVRMITNEVYSGMKSQKFIEQFTDLTKRAMQKFLKNKVNDRIAVALDDEQANITHIEQKNESAEPDTAKKSRITTTEEELEGFHAVKAILRSTIPVERITHRDNQSYFVILVDDNNRKPICRLHFNSTQKYVGILDEQKKETKYSISSIDDIYKFSDELLNVVQRYK
jgi:hypothetical protein